MAFLPAMDDRVQVALFPQHHLVLSVVLFVCSFVCLNFSCSNGCVRYLILVLMCLSLETKDVEHLFIWLCVICTSSIVMYLLKSFAFFFWLVDCCLFWEFKNMFCLQVLYKLYNLQIFFSQCVACTFILLTVYFEGQIFFNLMKSSLSSIITVITNCTVIPKNSLLNPWSQRVFFCIFFWKF